MLADSLRTIHRISYKIISLGIAIIFFLTSVLPANSYLFAATIVIGPSADIGDEPPFPDSLPKCSPGSLPGDAGVSCVGAATYAIPIEVPPGSADFQPALSLTYNSQASEGLLGMGWSINGLSSITRCAATVAVDGYKGGINYDSFDKFCLDGERLIPISPLVIGGVREYRTAVETFARIKSYGTTQTGADYFTVEDKLGLITEYGNTADGKIKALGSTEVRVWAANKLSDRSGNYINYIYANDDQTTGEFRITDIEYTGNPNTNPPTVPYNFVKFDYENRVGIPFYQGGSLVLTTKILNGIRTCLSDPNLPNGCTDNNLVKNYQLRYQIGVATNRWQLKTLTECTAPPSVGLPPACLPPTTMNWSDEGVTNLAGSITSGNYGNGRQWNGPNFGGANPAFMKTHTAIYQDAFVTNVRGIAAASDVGSVLLSSWATLNLVASFVIDPLYGAISYVVVALLKYLHDWITGGYWLPIGKLGDANGDGRTDVVGFSKKNDATEYVWLSKRVANGKNELLKQDTGNIWDTKPLRQFSSDDELEPDEVKLADFNGDGLMDVIGFEEKNALTKSDAYVYLSNGVDDFHYDPEQMNLQDIDFNEKKSIGHSALADFNGDGKSDIQMYSAQKHGAINLSTGDDFQEQGDWGFCNTLGIDCGNNDHPLEDVILGDVNGDGKADIVVLWQDNALSTTNLAKIWITNKDGNDWVDDTPVEFDFQSNFDRHSDTNPAVIMPGDFNGDGKMDLALFNANDSTYRVNDTDGDGVTGWPTDTDDIAVLDASFDVYLSTGRTFKHEPSFTKNFQSSTNLHIAPFALRNDHAPFSGHYVEGSKITFLPRAGDFNGDGKTDIMIFDVYKEHNAHLWLSDGTKLRDEINPGSAGSTGYWGSEFGLVNEDTLGDFDGDGRVDVLQFAFGGLHNQYDGQLNVTLSSSYPFPDLLVRVTDGYGKKDEFEYKPITDDSVYNGHTPITGVDAEIFNFRGPLYVVSEFRTSNGTRIPGNDMYKLKYKYQGAKSHRSYGFLGFSLIAVEDPQTQRTEITQYEQKYPLICHKRRSTVGVYGDPMLAVSTQDFEWSDSAGVAPHVHIVRLLSETNQTNELDGHTTKHTLTEYAYDPFSNVINQRIKWPDVSITAENTATTFSNNTASWILGLPTSTTVDRFEPNPVPARVMTRSFDPTTGLLNSTTEYMQSGKILTKTYDRDFFGNITKITVGGSVSSRTTKLAYDPQGRFLISVQNALGQLTQFTYDSRFGYWSKTIDPNGLATNWKYDNFGKQILETRPDHTTTATSYCPFTEATYAPQQRTAAWIQNKMSGAPDQTIFFDERGRIIREAVVGFDGTKVFADLEFNSNLQLKKYTLPYFYKSAKRLSTITFTYDTLGRTSTKTFLPRNSTTTWSYSGNVGLESNPLLSTLADSRLLWHKVVEKNALGQMKEYVINRLGQVNQVNHFDSAGTLLSTTTHDFDGFDNVIRTADINGNITLRKYEDNHMISLKDPDLGLSKYTYDALGQLEDLADANGKLQSYTYDLLGRLETRKEQEGISKWTYDSGAQAIGELSQVEGPNGFREEYLFDTFGRPTETHTTIPNDATIYRTMQTYDSAGRLDTLQYPPNLTGFKIKYEYNLSGYLEKISNVTVGSSIPIWKIDSLNPFGQITSETDGAGMSTRFLYTPETMIDSIYVGYKINGIAISPLKRLRYAYDSIGNMTERHDQTLMNNQETIEEFKYDGLNRATSSFSFINDNVQQVSIPLEEQKFEYDSIGNLTFKSNLSSFNPNLFYGGSTGGPHAATGACDQNVCYEFTYDANGNLIQGRDFQNDIGRTIDWFTFNKPQRITELSNTINLEYDPFRNKVKQAETDATGTTTTAYVSSWFEKVTLPSGAFENKHYIYANAATPVALFTMRSNGSNDMRFFHYDNLMSVDTITNSNAGIVENLSFDTYGLRRNPDWTSAATPIMSLTDHGYTNHEHIDTFGLIDMKGRMYDPSIGRFMSADPYVPDPLLSESFNRYSYVNNNPTSFVDPTGFQLCPSWAAPIATGTAVGSVALSAAGNALSLSNYAPPSPIATYIAATPVYQAPSNNPVSPEFRKMTSEILLNNDPYLSPEDKERIKQLEYLRDVSEELRQAGVPIYQIPFTAPGDPGMIKDQLLADLEKLAGSYDQIPSMYGQMGLELYEAKQRGASTAERLSIVLNWAGKIYGSILKSHKSAVRNGRIRVTPAETKISPSILPYKPYQSPLKTKSFKP